MNRHLTLYVVLVLPLIAVCACGGSRGVGDTRELPADGGGFDAGGDAENPTCAGRECGPDGLGGSCGDCINDCIGEPDPSLCHGGACAHACCPDCDGKDCGPDGCGGVCGQCVLGQECTPEFTCVVCEMDCAGKFCGDDAGCGLVCHGPCPNPNDQCAGFPGWFCMPRDCQPECTGKNCGDDDGCGRRCEGWCPGPEYCLAGPDWHCGVHGDAPDCTNKMCGEDDTMGGKCVGPCPDASKTCNPQTFVCE